MMPRLNYILLFIGFIGIPIMIKAECLDYRDQEICLNDCRCAWCQSPLQTACVTSGKSSDICSYWRANVTLAKDTEYCKKELEIGMILTFAPLACLLVFGTVMIIYCLYCRRPKADYIVINTEESENVE